LSGRFLIAFACRIPQSLARAVRSDFTGPHSAFGNGSRKTIQSSHKEANGPGCFIFEFIFALNNFVTQLPNDLVTYG
jgi:hypothetical protein